jgi:hypothetical protein
MTKLEKLALDLAEDVLLCDGDVDEDMLKKAQDITNIIGLEGSAMTAFSCVVNSATRTWMASETEIKQVRTYLLTDKKLRAIMFIRKAAPQLEIIEVRALLTQCRNEIIDHGKPLTSGVSLQDLHDKCVGPETSTQGEEILIPRSYVRS